MPNRSRLPTNSRARHDYFYTGATGATRVPRVPHTGATFTNFTELDHQIGDQESAGILRAHESVKCVENLPEVGVSPLQTVAHCQPTAH